eukprot:TRINITY_DN1492_c0_g2_i1.p1 TRINITY_DN1492_c0_g2~~TRINITY_DN1492_c0_g2_i1.p1  ORF type:complete len:340 (+),score=92.57 TRINITY_DN1492_c0_g2_i1:183-1202(+)
MLRLASLCLLAATAHVSMAAPVTVDAVLIGQFQGYITDFNKTYTSEEMYTRVQAFAGNLAKIAALNAEEGEEVYGLTKFSDLTPEEFKSRYLTYKPTGAREGVAVAQIPALDVSGTVDWRLKGMVTPVKNQGQCGSCWAFSATEQIESAWLMAGNKQQILAPQQITSCDKVDLGCNGGWPHDAYKYVEKAGGMVTEDQYPYVSGNTGATGTCESTVVAGKKAVSIKGFTYATTPKPSGNDANWKADEAKMASAMQTSGPVSICVDAETWQNYKKGVVTKSCGQELDHCVQAVGYNMAGSQKYWIVRNSWNTDWGLDGYLYVGYGGNYCGIADEATLVQV